MGLSTFSLVTSLALATGQLPAEPLKAYGRVLSAHVKDGLVNYKAIEGKHLADLDSFLELVGKANVPKDKDLALGFYVDAYNALVIKAVITHRIPRSVLDVPGFFDKFTYSIAGKSLTLDQLEKGVINPLAKDPRTHMVLVCAATSCPVLENKPYFGPGLDKRLEAATQRYLRSPAGADVRENAIGLAKIFEWYQNDFGGRDAVLTFVKKYLTPEALKKLGPNPKVSYLDYAWTLNAAP